MHDPHFDGVSRLRTPGEPHADNGGGEGESLDQRTSFHHLNDKQAFLVTLCVGVSNLFWLPLMGALSDRVGRRPLLIIFTL
ncbi:hypothetical protein HZD82_23835, partial [Pantoea agglomerans]|nr:hypothetical protein [Pantoea agglomerans]